MKVQYCSDLHLEFGYNKVFLQAHPLKAEGEILLLAGDIIPFAAMDRANWFFDFVSDHFETTYWVPGNHEYYRSTISGDLTLNRKIRENVFLINNHALIHRNVKFIFSTLWSEISPANEWEIQQSMSDFSLIKYGHERFTSFRFNEVHHACRKFVSDELERKEAEKVVVVTHHVPTLMNYPPKYRDSSLNEAFAVELYDLIEQSNAEYWIYGHHHQRVADFSIGHTILSTNQLGYVEYGEHNDFTAGRTIVL
jgi:predicted phosphohydrolase